MLSRVCTTESIKESTSGIITEQQDTAGHLLFVLTDHCRHAGVGENNLLKEQSRSISKHFDGRSQCDERPSTLGESDRATTQHLTQNQRLRQQEPEPPQGPPTTLTRYPEKMEPPDCLARKQYLFGTISQQTLISTATTVHMLGFRDLRDHRSTLSKCRV